MSRLIDSYEFGVIVINGKRYTTDVIIFLDRVQDGWWRQEGHVLHLEDLRQVLDAKVPPDVLVVGIGYSGAMRISNEVITELGSRNIRVIACPTKQACQAFDEISKAGRRVVAALHLTC